MQECVAVLINELIEANGLARVSDKRCNMAKQIVEPIQIYQVLTLSYRSRVYRYRVRADYAIDAVLLHASEELSRKEAGCTLRFFGERRLLFIFGRQRAICQLWHDIELLRRKRT